MLNGRRMQLTVLILSSLCVAGCGRGPAETIVPQDAHEEQALTPPPPAAQYAGVFRKQTLQNQVVLDADWNTFTSNWSTLSGQGYRLQKLETHVAADGTLRLDGVYVHGSGGYYLWVGVSQADFLQKNTDLTNAGYRLTDMDTYVDGAGVHFAGTWREGTGASALFLEQVEADFLNTKSQQESLGLRLVDLEVRSAGAKNYFSSYWQAASDGEFVQLDVEWGTFSKKWLDQRWARHLASVEAYDGGGLRLYAGVFRDGANVGEEDVIGSVDKASFLNKVALERNAGRELVAVLYDPAPSQRPHPYFAAPMRTLENLKVGFSWAIRDSGLYQSEGGYGLARANWETVDPGVPLTSLQRVHIASMSKPITSAAVHHLRDQLGIPVNALVKDLMPGVTVHPDNDYLTLRDLLSHNSGFPNGTSCSSPDLPTAVANILAQPNPSAPTKNGPVHHEYANINYCVLRRIVELQTGKSFVQYVTDQVLGPLGIPSVTCTPDVSRATLYYAVGQTTGPGGATIDHSSDCAAYGFYASAASAARFWTGMRNNVVLSAAATTEFFDRQALIWNDTPQGSEWGHNGGWNVGSDRGSASAFGTVPGLGIDYALLVNAWPTAANNFDPYAIMQEGFVNVMQ